MSLLFETGSPDISRREFLSRATVIAGGCILSCETEAQKTEPVNFEKALNDKNVIHGKVTFRSGAGQIAAYLARPGVKGRFAVVVLVSGSSIDDEYIRNTTAMLAQSNFVGIAPDIYSRQMPNMSIEEKRKVLAEQITDERILQDIQGAIDYLKIQEFANVSRIGITGFCFGGRCALMFAAAHPMEIGAVVPFYGNLKTPAFANRKEDPIDVVEKIKSPVQGHYAENDGEIPLEELEKFKIGLTKNGSDIEIFTYPAPHGFFSYNRPTYDPAAAKLSWQRTTAFLKKHLSK